MCLSMAIRKLSYNTTEKAELEFKVYYSCVSFFLLCSNFMHSLGRLLTFARFLNLFHSTTMRVKLNVLLKKKG